MLTRISFFIFILLINLNLATAQLYYVNLPPGHNKITLGRDRIPGLAGSPYLYDEWEPGRIILHNGNVIDSLYMRYDVYAREIHYKAEGNIYILGSPDSVKSITLYSRHFEYLPFTEKKNTVQKDYFEVLTADGRAQLLIRHMVTRIKSNYNVALDVGEKDDRLEHKSLFYLRRDKTILLIDRKGKALMEMLIDKSRELENFVSQNRLSFTREADLKRVVDYYNSLYD
ncbi:MAG TPA: hypothetical protein PLS58_06280 [Bacteroidales bacterium]|nr:hypothetical protein [Bacteroidales bacterium]